MILRKILVVLMSVVIVLTATLAVYNIKEEAAKPIIFPVAAAENEKSEGTVYTSVPSKVTKSETVYVNLNNAGGVTEINVSDKITTDIPQCIVADVSSLTDIKTISSKPLKRGDAESFLWHLGTNQLIYNGKSTKRLPIDISISYTLNGEKTTAEDLRGKQGHVGINISLKNNESRSLSVNGKQMTVYSPFIVVGGMVLPGKGYSSVTVDNGKILSDASKDIVMTVGFPGLNESLNLQKLGITDLNFADSFNLEMDTTDFRAGDFYFAVLPLSMIDIDFALPDSITGAMDGVRKLTDLQNSLASIDIEKLMKVFSSESCDNLTELLGSLSQVNKLYDNNSALISLAKKYGTAENIGQFRSFFTSLEEANIAENIERYKNVASLLGISDLITQYEQMQPILDSLMADLNDPKVQAAIDALPQTIATLESMKALLDKNSAALTEMSDFLNSDGFDSLIGLMKSYNENKNLFAALSSTAGSLGELVPYLESWFKLANDYSIYTEAAANMDTSVMFVYKTAPLK